ncbi:MAG TPA: prepilin-type N-terminal cleavage/methylation domain-containing protein [Phycisphaerae bacterium]|nr:prepilin-type N-terminal cleavage/methylation domain-containing protein [Phycisphaerae bacterium]
MPICFSERGIFKSRSARAFSLLELLVVLAITSIVLAILLPSLSAARESANATKCLVNLREIGAASLMYMDDEGYPTQPWHMGLNAGGADIDKVSEFVFGGFQVDPVHPVLGQRVDIRKIATIDRPYNRYIAPQLCNGPVQTYVCPSDSFAVSSFPADPCAVPVRSENVASWSINGNSYAINWNWLAAPPWSNKPSIYSDLNLISAAGREMLRLKVGGDAANFVLHMESTMNSMMQDGRPADGSAGQSCLQQLGIGWHKRYSRYSMSFLDGHSEHRFIDTRFSRDTGYDLWPEPYTPAGF